MVFLDSYFDESYSAETDLIVAGFVSTVDRWAILSTQWKKILDENGLPYFHFFEYKNGRCYPHLSFVQRAKILDSLVDLITEHAMFCVSTRISPKEYESLLTPQQRQKHGSPYSLGVIGCVTDAGVHLKKMGFEYAELGVYLEEGEHIKQALDWLRTIKRGDAKPDLSAFTKDGTILRVIDDREPPLVKLGTIAEGSKTTHPPLQVADMLAYSARTPDTPWTETVLKRLRGSMDYIESHWNRNMISIVMRGLALAEEEMAVQRRMVNLFRFLNHLGITVKTVPGTIIFDFRERKDITRDELQQMIREHTAPGRIRKLSEFWENLEAYWQAKGTVIHEGLRTEMLETIAEIEARSDMPVPDEE